MARKKSNKVEVEETTPEVNEEETVETVEEGTTEPEVEDVEEEQVANEEEEKAPVEAIKKHLKPLYEEYTRTVSPSTEAISFQLTEKLVDTLMSYDGDKPLKVLDGGSGWSSVVLRALATVIDMEVHTIDTRLDWLNKTMKFLQNKGLDTERTYTSPHKLPEKTKYDVVIHDLGRCDAGERAEFLPEVYKLVAKGGILILDDLHKPAYREAVDELLKKVKAKLVSWETETKDQYGRFAGVVHKK